MKKSREEFLKWLINTPRTEEVNPNEIYDFFQTQSAAVSNSPRLEDGTSECPCCDKPASMRMVSIDLKDKGAFPAEVYFCAKTGFEWMTEKQQTKFYSSLPPFNPGYIQPTPTPSVQEVLVPWYCRKCQSTNADITDETCPECGEDFPDGWNDTRNAVAKLKSLLSGTPESHGRGE